jgi:phosphopantothenoylcysteine synthetase/decarboxylase
MTTHPRPRYLVTAGNTRERIDAVRDMGNVFTGRTGYEIARALASSGEVDLLTSNETHLAATPGATGFKTHEELKSALANLMARHAYDGVFMTAAVADYRPTRVYEVVERRQVDGGETWLVRDVQAAKVKSSHPQVAVLAERTEKLVDLFRTAWGHRGLLVKFKLEVGIGREELLKVGQSSRISSGADYLVANTLDMVTGPDAGAYLLCDARHEWVPRADLPGRMVALATAAAGRR